MNKEAIQSRIDRLRGQGPIKVETVQNSQFYPTPHTLAARMAALLDAGEGHRVLEPSAGSGNLLRALPEHCESIAVEVDRGLSARLHAFDYPWPHLQCVYMCKDFLTLDPAEFSGKPFDRVIMNPPFIDGEDIKHTLWALQFLKPGGRLVGLCAGGPRQEKQIKPLADYWERLPSGTFKDAGTMVSACLFVINK